MIGKLPGGMKWVRSIGYADDVSGFSETFACHLKHSEAFFRKLAEAGLQLKPEKRSCGRLKRPAFN